jgi:hypothetical protein
MTHDRDVRQGAAEALVKQMEGMQRESVELAQEHFVKHAELDRKCTMLEVQRAEVIHAYIL